MSARTVEEPPNCRHVKLSNVNKTIFLFVTSAIPLK